MAGVVAQSYHPEKQSIGDLLALTNPAIVVPDWQRNYSWRIEHVETLWNDLTLFSDRVGTRITEEYFFGSLVLVNAADQRLLLLDGQQRLATCSILLSAIRDTLNGLDDKLSAYLQDNYLCAYDAIKKDVINKLQLNVYDRDFFKRLISVAREDGYVEPVPQYASHHMIKGARAYFLRVIEDRTRGMQPEEKADWLRRLVDILANHFTVIAAYSDNENKAAEVFETLNDRGIGLSTPDLLRNFVIRRTPEGQRPDVVARWEDVIAFDTDSEIKAFLRHYWISKHGDVKTQSLYREVKSVIEQQNIDSAGLSAELSDAAKLYRRIKNAEADTETDADILSAIDSVGAGASILYPAILSIFGTLKGEEITTALTALLNIYTRDGIIGGIENSVLENRFHRGARDLRGHASLAQLCAALADGALTDDDVRNRFERLSLTQNGPRRYLLHRIELAKRGTEELTVNPPSKVHVEHIYPQTPGAGQRWANHERLVNRLGNLSLLDKRINSGIRNGVFAAKKPYYAKSEIAMTRELVSYDEWTEDRIAVRQAEFAGLVPGLWPIVKI
ncbi:DUF262 domain-containing HNH endonuclease family protein [Caulobacter segnis]|uniref:DUF262 domain-containing protein n=1 Tax=Caulobacter segnis TaxID=88688 RepID=UPI00240FACC0|nr:DUF262 domain-containing HNH endonuclease family protein [Caulobacter segnis]MDG2521210.1 DUF262 domain-containing HNH endonuclease family protein [Caulobacter segnis]